MEKDCISIVVPVYNCHDYLEKCLDSLIHQTYQNLEIVLVDDGSKDDSGAICDRYAIKDKRIKVIHQENGGVAIARNVGVKNTSGKYIGFVDSDDFIELNMYESLYQSLTHNQADIACCGRIDEPMNRKVFQLDEPIVYDKQQAMESFLLTKTIGGSFCEKLYRRELLEDINFITEYIPDDFITLYSIFKKANKISHTGLASYHYLYRTSSVSHSKFNPKYVGLTIYSKQILNDVQESFPSLVDEAQYLFFHKTIYGAKLAIKDSGKKQDLQTFVKEIKENYTEIQKNKYLERSYKVFASAIKFNIAKLVVTIASKLKLMH